LSETEVSVEIPPLDSLSETVVLRGEPEKLGLALTTVYAKVSVRLVFFFQTTFILCCSVHARVFVHFSKTNVAANIRVWLLGGERLGTEMSQCCHQFI